MEIGVQLLLRGVSHRYHDSPPLMFLKLDFINSLVERMKTRRAEIFGFRSAPAAYAAVLPVSDSVESISSD